MTNIKSVVLDCNSSFLITLSELVEGIFEVLAFYNSDYISDFLNKRNLGSWVYETSLLTDNYFVSGLLYLVPYSFFGFLSL